MMVESIEDPTMTHLTLKNLDRHSHYRFYLRGRTSTGEGESIKRDGATTLDGGAKIYLPWHFNKILYTVIYFGQKKEHLKYVPFKKMKST